MNIIKRKGLIPKGRNKRKTSNDHSGFSRDRLASSESINSGESKVRSEDIDVKSQKEKKSKINLLD